MFGGVNIFEHEPEGKERPNDGDFINEKGTESIC